MSLRYGAFAFLLTLFIGSNQLKAQQLFLLDQQGNRLPSDTVRVVFHPGPDHGWTEISLFLQIGHTSNKALNVLARKSEMNIISGEYHAICFAGSCFDSTVFESPLTAIIQPGDTDESFSGHFRFDDLLHPKRTAWVRYTFINADSIADSVNLHVAYDTESASGLQETSMEQRRQILYPNPSMDGKVYVGDIGPDFKTLEVMDRVGRHIGNVNCLSDGLIDLSGLSPGLYWLLPEGYYEPLRLVISGPQ